MFQHGIGQDTDPIAQSDGISHNHNSDNMKHPDKNQLATFYYQEDTSSRHKKITTHVNSCNSCQEYLHTIATIEAMFDRVQDETPLLDTFENILNQVSRETNKPVRDSRPLLVKPILNIAFSMMAILAFIYLIQSRISLLPIWSSLSQFWIVDMIGSFGAVFILFFFICSFITLSFAPVLIISQKQMSQQKSNSNGLHFESGVHLN